MPLSTRTSPPCRREGLRCVFDNQPHPALLKISGDNQKGAALAPLSQPFVVEAQDAKGAASAGVAVTFAVVTGGGTLSTTNTMTDANGRAQSTLTLGPNLGINTVAVSATGIAGRPIFQASSDTLPTEYLWGIPAGMSLIHVPLQVTIVDGVPKTLPSIAALYEALGGAATVTLLITHDPTTQSWHSYVGDISRGTTADAALTDTMGVIANMTAPVTMRLGGSPLGTAGNSVIALTPGLNLSGGAVA